MLSQDERTRPSGSQAIERAAQLLVLVLEQDRPTTLGELARLTELPKSTTSRLVAALERNALVQRDSARGAIRPGPAVLRFAQRGVDDADLVALSQTVLHALAGASGETINLAVPGPDGVEHLAQEDTAHFVGTTVWVGRRVPFELAANGKVFLAFGLAEQATPELTRIRARGYATSVDELELGLSALAAPVFGPGGEALAALSISGPSNRLTSERIAQLAPLLMEEATQLAERLGHHDHARGAA